RNPDGTDLRWVVLHLINETARHSGHADATRELLDGVTGEWSVSRRSATSDGDRDLDAQQDERPEDHGQDGRGNRPDGADVVEEVMGRRDDDADHDPDQRK